MKRIIIRICILSITLVSMGFQYIPLTKDTWIPDKPVTEDADKTTLEPVLPKEILEIMEKQKPALQAYEKLWDYFDHDEYGFPIYPEEYAGEYINEGVLVIQLVEGTQQEQVYREICENSKAITFEYVKNSMNYLLSLRDIILSFAYKYSIIGLELDVKKNKMIISMDKNDYTDLLQESEIKKISNAISIKVGEKPVMCTASLYGGNAIFNSNNLPYTMCVCGTYNGNAAILTCGHGIAQNESFSRLGLNLGSVVIQRCNDNLLAYNTQDTSSYGDFSIITINTGNFTTTNKVLTSINSTASITGVYSFPPVGTDVCKYGNSTQLVYGKIASHYNYGTFTMVQGNSTHDYYLNGMTKISLLGGGVNGVLTNNGDSGGPVFVQNPSSSGKCICGSISAGSPSGTECYYSPVTYPAAIGFVTKTN